MSYEALLDDFIACYGPSGQDACRRSFEALAQVLDTKGLLNAEAQAVARFLSLPREEAEAIYIDLQGALLSLGYKGSSVDKRLMPIRQIVKVARRAGIIRWELALQPLPHGRPKGVGAETLRELVKWALKKRGGTLLYWKRNGHRNAAILYLVGLGFTMESICEARISDFYPVERTVKDPRTEDRRFFLPQEALRHLCAWIAYRARLRPLSDHLFVEARQPARPLQPFAVEKIIITLSQGCPVGHINPRLLIGCLQIPKRESRSLK